MVRRRNGPFVKQAELALRYRATVGRNRQFLKLLSRCMVNLRRSRKMAASTRSVVASRHAWRFKRAFARWQAGWSFARSQLQRIEATKADPEKDEADVRKQTEVLSEYTDTRPREQDALRCQLCTSSEPQCDVVATRCKSFNLVFMPEQLARSDGSA